jgi:hypothetical protein
LTTLRTIKEPEDRLGRLIYKIQHLDFTLRYRRGEKHSNADMLSRLNTIQIRQYDWKAEQEKCDDLKQVKECIVRNKEIMRIHNIFCESINKVF